MYRLEQIHILHFNILSYPPRRFLKLKLTTPQKGDPKEYHTPTPHPKPST
jgi:hypothetical protein